MRQRGKRIARRFEEFPYDSLFKSHWYLLPYSACVDVATQFLWEGEKEFRDAVPVLVQQLKELRPPTKCGGQGPSRLLNHAHSLTVARMVSLPRFGSLWAFGPSAHRARASLRACRGLGQSPKALCRSILPRALRASEGRKKRGFLQIQGFFNGLPRVLQGRGAACYGFSCASIHSMNRP